MEQHCVCRDSLVVPKSNTLESGIQTRFDPARSWSRGLKLIALLSILLIPLLASCRAVEPTSSPTTAAPVSAFALVLVDTGEVLLTENDISAYYSDNQTFTLNDRGIEKWNAHMTYPGIPKLADTLYQREFVITVDGKEVCRGKFWSGVSSQSIDGIVIMDALFRLSSDRNVIWIKSEYPGGSRGLDSSINSALVKALPKP